MPNHVQNKVTFTGKVIDLMKVKKKLGMPHYMLDEVSPFNFFNLIAPTDEQTYKQGSHWYDWNVSNWGTKWNAYGLECNFVALDNDDDNKLDEITYEFNTAWSPPGNVIRATAQWLEDTNLDVDMYWWYEEEQGWGGSYAYSAEDGFGEVEQWDIPQSHEDYVNRGYDCMCVYGDEPPFSDCPNQPPVFIVKDWAGNILYNGKQFNSFEEGWGYIHEVDPKPENDPDEHYYDDYYVEEKK